MEKRILTEMNAPTRRVICAIVCFNPSPKMSSTIGQTLLQVDHIVIVDNNSDSSNRSLKNIENRYSDRISIIYNKENVQFAAGMNIAIKKAISLGAEYILQLNDDNYLSEGAVDAMLNCFKLPTSSPIGIVSPTVLIGNEFDFIPSCNVTEHSLIASAGMLIPAVLFNDLGYYDEDLVIGYDDYDLSLRANNLGYRCLVTGEAALFANLGRMEKRRLLTKQILVFHYSPIRRYYAARNGLFLLRRWHKSAALWRWVFWWEANSIIGILFFEKNKTRKVFYTLAGYLNGLRKKMGHLPARGYK